MRCFKIKANEVKNLIFKILLIHMESIRATCFVYWPEMRPVRPDFLQKQFSGRRDRLMDSLMIGNLLEF